ncbi:hypothetical protein [Sphingomonas sp. M1A8_2b]
MENTASPLDLFTRLEIAIEERNEAAEAFDVFKQDSAMAHAPDPGVAPAVTSDDAADMAAQEAATFTAETDALLRGASDAELLDAYRQPGGEIGNPVAEALLGEIRGRGLSV